jgi:hypothetical protein
MNMKSNAAQQGKISYLHNQSSLMFDPVENVTGRGKDRTPEREPLERVLAESELTTRVFPTALHVCAAIQIACGSLATLETCRMTDMCR